MISNSFIFTLYIFLQPDNFNEIFVLFRHCLCSLFLAVKSSDAHIVHSDLSTNTFVLMSSHKNKCVLMNLNCSAHHFSGQ